MEDTRITLRDTRNNDRSSDRVQQLGRFFPFLSLSSILRSRRKPHPIEFPFRGRVRGGCTRYSRFYVPRIRTCRGGVAKTGDASGLELERGKFEGGVNSALIGDEGKSGDRKAVVERCRVVGNFMETRIYA